MAIFYGSPWKLIKPSIPEILAPNSLFLYINYGFLSSTLPYRLHRCSLNIVENYRTGGKQKRPKLIPVGGRDMGIGCKAEGLFSLTFLIPTLSTNNPQKVNHTEVTF